MVKRQPGRPSESQFAEAVSRWRAGYYTQQKEVVQSARERRTERFLRSLGACSGIGAAPIIPPVYVDDAVRKVADRKIIEAEKLWVGIKPGQTLEEFIDKQLEE